MRSKKLVDTITTAPMVELADTLVLEASDESREGSSPSWGTRNKKANHENRRTNRYSTSK